ncbi:N-6 DNA methylase [Candidatus Mycosynbacter amalyticus]|uniref:site-specific DNA-methyltransferase (adenine-specific) n=1 Tax=Candidatus Mycosynbacter amalyticus TaxID=2665156 RepID=A0A857MM49_9BACT|nr:DNA methyltransferase [Candidatus Mycosynbacter amalyticus]QHN42885.1 N-6 DNA methylase [Candidatus Mycosynbacter amalyticus]
MRLAFADVQRNVTELANRESYNIDILYELLAAYGRASSAITKLRQGSLNLASDKENDVLQRGVVYFRHITDSSKLRSTLEELEQDPLVVRYNPRYLIVTDYDKLVAIDTKKDTRLDINLRDIDRDVDFFYGWTGDEITDEKTEAVADRRAADKMQELYSEIEKFNAERLADPQANFRHDLNVFFSRLLFCFFAEDTRVFSNDEKAIFTGSIKDYTQTDGSDLDTFLRTLFDALDTEDKSSFTSPFSKFPYVNGTIFDTKKHSIGIPKFNAQARKLILDCGNLNWSEINPDIFGSMFQSIVDENQRHTHGQHYTSVPNIMKTIEPLFLDELREEFDKHYDNPSKLIRLWERISKIKVFDPACGSGNFLIIAYKEMRKIEHAIIERLLLGSLLEEGMKNKLSSQIKLDNFYGIEIDDFPHEIAILSLYLAKHQMNIEFEKQFGREIKLIPLKDNANIIHGNAARLDWNDVCSNVPHAVGIPSAASQQSELIGFENESEQQELVKEEYDEIYLIGNPPYGGARWLDAAQKEDMQLVLGDIKGYGNLDYIAVWFKKAADYIGDSNKCRAAIISTNSIVQGVQVELLWSYIFDTKHEIIFAHQSFKWQNSARNNAGVTVVVIGIGSESSKDKYIYNGGIRQKVDNINAYLSSGSSTIVMSRSKPLSSIPSLDYGSFALDDGHFTISLNEYKDILKASPDAEKFLKPFVGAAEFLRGIERYAVWINEADIEEAKQIPILNKKIQAVYEWRMDSKRASTKKLASTPWRFAEIRYQDRQCLIAPIVSSERRQYIPMSILPKGTVVSNAAFAIYDAEPWLLGILSSKMHMAWVRAVGGQLETRLRYSASVVYNTFPLRPLLEHEKQELTAKARSVLFARENHSEKTLAEMYDPDKMPEDLRQAHEELDVAVDRLYRQKPYNSDEERLADLFALYEQMTNTEKDKK